MINNKKSEKIIIKKLSRKVKIKPFLISILSNIKFSLDNKAGELDITITENEIIIKDNNTTTSVKISDRGVLYTSEFGNLKEIEEYIETKKGYMTKKRQEMKTICDLGKNYRSVDKTIAESVSLYDKKKHQTYRRYHDKNKNYYENKKTKEKMLCKPKVMKNYTKNIYYFKIEDKYVVERYTVKYTHPEDEASFIPLHNADSFYLRYEPLSKDEKKSLPMSGAFHQFDNDIFFKYRQKKATVIDMYKSAYSKKYKVK